MELNWTTFLLEILNFLVLVWVLARFLYKPVLGVIERRRAAIEQTLADAARVRREADQVRDQYEHRLTDWEREKETARARLREELDAERTRAVAKLQASLEGEREKARVLEARRLSELTRQAEEAAVAQGGAFAGRLLDRLADQPLETRLVALALEDLKALPEAQRQAIRTAATKEAGPVAVTSAFSLDAAQRDAITAALQTLLGRPVSCDWAQDPALKAGLRLTAGPWVLRASLQDELTFFTEAARHAGSTAGA